MGILEKLMETDAQKLMKRSKKGYEVKRISELLGEPFIVELRPVTVAEIDSAQEMSKGVVDMRAMVVLQAATVEGKRLTDKSFLEKFGTPSGREVVEKLFMPGEIETMFNIVNRLSGYGNVIKEVKKLLRAGDGLAMTMYLAWTKHGTLPGVVYNMPVGERIVLRAFLEYEMEKH